MIGERLIIRGQVQGVGFRPTVWRIATEMGLTGDVRNTSEGVEIRLWGDARRDFECRLRMELPKLARIEALERLPIADPAPARFEIASSASGTMRASVTPDAATCPDCLAEVRDAADRRYRYPFANCTNCGPRFSIVEGAPYDRTKTTMAAFAMCGDCADEYADPTDRRFHAQPVACPACGPHAWIEKPCAGPVSSETFAARDEMDAAGRLLVSGHILAVKGIGGFHLACDATNAAAVERLRARKGRVGKAFALMARDLGMIRKYCAVSEAEAALLTSAPAPIVLLRNDLVRLPEAIAPGLDRLGFMLPYTPMHHLMLENVDRPVVMTSGNISGEPQATTNADARERLAGIADYLLMHDRDIANRIDDSVMRVDLGTPRLLRRARGYAPSPISLPDGFSKDLRILAMGAQLKNTFCLVRDGDAILSQHMGDLEDAATADDVTHNLRLYRQLYEFDPDAVAVDLHPDYRCSRHGHDLAAEADLPVVEAQHHHAHIAACLAESGRPLDTHPVLGIAMDGLGLGDDGTIWGGEFLIADYRTYRRAAHFKPVALPGGTSAIREPWRNVYAHLIAAVGWDSLEGDYGDLPLVRKLTASPRSTLDAMIRTGTNSPLSSSCGRLFDAVAAAAGLAWGEQTYEGEAAMTLEAAIDRSTMEEPEASAYVLAISSIEGTDRLCLDPSPMWRAILEDLRHDPPAGTIAARFHRGLARALTELAARLAEENGLDTVALSGGCFQNETLFRLVHEGLDGRGLHVLSHSKVPANDGGLALGQAVIALAAIQKGGAHVPWNSRTDR